MSLNPDNANNYVNFVDMLASLEYERDEDIYNKVTAKGYRPTRPFRCMDCTYKTRSYKNRLKHKMLLDHKFDT